MLIHLRIQPPQRFNTIDVTGDGKLSKADILAHQAIERSKADAEPRVHSM